MSAPAERDSGCSWPEMLTSCLRLQYILYDVVLNDARVKELPAQVGPPAGTF